MIIKISLASVEVVISCGVLLGRKVPLRTDIPSDNRKQFTIQTQNGLFDISN